FCLGGIGHELQPGRQPGLRAAIRLRNPAEQLARARRNLRRIGAHLPQHFGHDAFALLDERSEQVLRFYLRMAHRLGEPLRGKNGFLGFFGVFVDVHGSRSEGGGWSYSTTASRRPASTDMPGSTGISFTVPAFGAV